MRSRLYIHLVWTTRGRAPMIDAERAEFLMRFLPAIARQERASALAVGMVSTHLHILLRIVPATVISRMVQRMKGGSSRIAGREKIGTRPLPLLWDEGYNLVSVSPRALEPVSRYILSQAIRHPDEAIVGWAAEEQMRQDLAPRYSA